MKIWELFGIGSFKLMLLIILVNFSLYGDDVQNSAEEESIDALVGEDLEITRGSSIVKAPAITVKADTISPSTGKTLTTFTQSAKTTKDLTVSGNTTCSGTLTITKATTLNSTLGVKGNLSVNTNKFTTNATTGNTTIAGTLGVAGTSNLGALNTSGVARLNSLNVINDETVGGTLDVINNQTVGGTLNVTGDTTLQNLNAAENATLNTVTVNGITTLNDWLDVKQGTTLEGPLDVYGDVVLSQGLTVNDAQVNVGSIDVYGTTSLIGDLTVNGTTQFNDCITITDGKTLYVNEIDPVDPTSTTSFSGHVLIKDGKNLNVSGSTTIDGNLVALGDTIIQNTSVNGTLGVAGDTNLSTLNASDVANLNSLTVRYGTTLDKTLQVSGNTTLAYTYVNGMLEVEDVTNLYNGANITNGTTLRGGTVVHDGIICNGGTIINGGATADSFNITGTENVRKLVVTGDSTLNALGVTNNQTVGGTLSVTGLTTLNNTLDVKQGTTLESTLDVYKNTGINGSLNVSGLTALNELTTDGSAQIDSLDVTYNATFNGFLGITGSCGLKLKSNIQANSEAFSLSPLGNFVAVNNYNGNEIKIFTVTDAGEISNFSTSSKSTDVQPYWISWSPVWSGIDGGMLAVTNIGSNTVQIFGVDIYGNISDALSTQSISSDKLAWAPNGRFIAVISSDIQIFGVDSHGVISSKISSIDILSSSISWSPSWDAETGGYLVITDTASNSIKVFSVDGSGNISVSAISSQSTESGPYPVAWSHSGNFIAVACVNAQIIQIFGVNKAGILSPIISSAPTGDSPNYLDWSYQSNFIAVTNMNVMPSAVQIYSIDENGNLSDEIGHINSLSGQARLAEFSKNWSIESGGFILVNDIQGGKLKSFESGYLGYSFYADESLISLNNNTSIEGNNDVGGNLNVLGNTSIGGVLETDGDSRIKANLSVSDSITVYGTINARGGLVSLDDATFQRNIQTASIRTNSLDVSYGTNLGGDVSISGDFNVIGNTNLHGKVYIKPLIALTETVSAYTGPDPVSVAWSPNWDPNTGGFIAVANRTGWSSTEGTIRTFHVDASGNLSSVISTQRTDHTCPSVAWSPSGDFLAVVNRQESVSGGKIKIFGVDVDGNIINLFGVHERSIAGKPISVTWSPSWSPSSGGFIAVAVNKDASFVNDYVTTTQVDTSGVIGYFYDYNRQITSAGAYSVAWSPNWDSESGGLIAAVSSNSLQTLSINTSGNISSAISSKPATSAPHSTVWSPLGDFIAVANQYQTLQIFSVDVLGNFLSTIRSQPTRSGGYSVAWSPNWNSETGGLIAIANVDSNTIQIFDVDAEGNLSSSEVGYANTGSSPYSLAWSPLGDFIAVVNNGSNTVQVFPVNI